MERGSGTERGRRFRHWRPLLLRRSRGRCRSRTRSWIPQLDPQLDPQLAEARGMRGRPGGERRRPRGRAGSGRAVPALPALPGAWEPLSCGGRGLATALSPSRGPTGSWGMLGQERPRRVRPALEGWVSVTARPAAPWRAGHSLLVPKGCRESAQNSLDGAFGVGDQTLVGFPMIHSPAVNVGIWGKPGALFLGNPGLHCG